MLTKIKKVLRESGTDVDEQSTILTESVLIKIIEEVFSLLEIETPEIVKSSEPAILETANLILPSGSIGVSLSEYGTSLIVDKCEVPENFCGSAIIHIGEREIHCNACNNEGETVAELLVEKDGIAELRRLKIITE